MKGTSGTTARLLSLMVYAVVVQADSIHLQPVPGPVTTPIFDRYQLCQNAPRSTRVDWKAHLQHLRCNSVSVRKASPCAQ